MDLKHHYTDSIPEKQRPCDTNRGEGNEKKEQRDI